MDQEGNNTGTVSEKNFIPDGFIEVSYEHFTGSRREDEYVAFILKALHRVYRDGRISGERLLDIGSGPVVHQVFAASKWFKEIVLSDLWEENLEVLQKWKSGSRIQQKSVFQYMIGLEGSGETFVNATRTLVQKVRAIVALDIRDTKLLSGTEAEGLTFDAINVTLVHMIASKSIEEFKTSVLNYSRMLKSGGHLIVIEPLGASYYYVKQDRFAELSVGKEDIQALFRSCGFDIAFWEELGSFYFPRGDAKSMFIMVAKKTKA